MVAIWGRGTFDRQEEDDNLGIFDFRLRDFRLAAAALMNSGCFADGDTPRMEPMGRMGCRTAALRFLRARTV
jgi:hypothetical protein